MEDKERKPYVRRAYVKPARQHTSIYLENHHRVYLNYLMERHDKPMNAIICSIIDKAIKKDGAYTAIPDDKAGDNE